ncbi:MAG: hypothetical protein HY582_03850 [Candidatus Omnitrophica bacterium]|nr:hypothetical protein [Candidatus Omnitrophota bacterium]
MKMVPVWLVGLSGNVKTIGIVGIPNVIILIACGSHFQERIGVTEKIPIEIVHITYARVLFVKPSWVKVEINVRKMQIVAVTENVKMGSALLCPDHLCLAKLSAFSMMIVLATTSVKTICAFKKAAKVKVIVPTLVEHAYTWNV